MSALLMVVLELGPDQAHLDESNTPTSTTPPTLDADWTRDADSVSRGEFPPIYRWAPENHQIDLQFDSGLLADGVRLWSLSDAELSYYPQRYLGVGASLALIAANPIGIRGRIRAIAQLPLASVVPYIGTGLSVTSAYGDREQLTYGPDFSLGLKYHATRFFGVYVDGNLRLEEPDDSTWQPTYSLSFGLVFTLRRDRSHKQILVEEPDHDSDNRVDRLDQCVEFDASKPACSEDPRWATHAKPLPSDRPAVSDEPTDILLPPQNTWMLFFADGRAEFASRVGNEPWSPTPGLNALAAPLATDPTLCVRIIGYADERGTKDGNEQLSQDRAKKVAADLVELAQKSYDLDSDARTDLESRVLWEGRGELGGTAPNEIQRRAEYEQCSPNGAPESP